MAQEYEKEWSLTSFMYSLIIGPGQANLVVIDNASSESSGEPAHPRNPVQSRQNLRCSLIQAMSQWEPSDRQPGPSEWLGMSS